MDRLSQEFSKAGTPVQYATLIAIYTFVHGLLLLNQNFFWDDWIWKLNPAEFDLALNQLGFVFFKETFKTIYTLDIFWAKLATFSFYLAAGLLLFSALNTLRLTDGQASFFIALLFMIMPYNIVGRSTLSTFTYGLTLLLFFGSYLCYLQFRIYGWRLSGILAFFLLIFSFNTASFLVFSIALVALTEVFLQRNKKSFPWGVLIPTFVVLAQASLFFYIKKTYFPTSGPYADYNQTHFSLISLFKFMLSWAPAHFFDPLIFSFSGKDLFRMLQPHLKSILYFVLMMAPLVASYVKRRNLPLMISLAAIGLIYAADFPYAVVGKSANSFNWDSRNQLLLPLGASLWIYSAILLWGGMKRDLFLKICVVIFSLGTMRLYLGTQGIAYQDRILHFKLGQLVDPNDPHSYFLEYTGSPPSVLETEWNFYELTGMLYANFGHQKNSIITSRQAALFKGEKLGVLTTKALRSRYMLKDARIVNPGTCILMQQKTPLNDLKILQLMAIERLKGREELLKSLDDMYIFSQSPVDSSDLTSIRCS